MKIPRELPQFINRKTIIVATGNQKGKIWIAQNGTLDLLKEIFLPQPHYSDREGFQWVLGRIGNIGSGSVYESKEDEVEKRFLNRLRDEIAFAAKKEKFLELYLFSPRYFAGRVLRKLSPEIRMKTMGIFYKNDVNFPALELLKEIKTQLELGQSVALQSEARRILKDKK